MERKLFERFLKTANRVEWGEFVTGESVTFATQL